MSTKYDSHLEDSSYCGHKHSHQRGRCSKGRWTPMNIAAMVLGFVCFWPVGLLVLFWILSGRNVQDLPEAVREKWQQFFGDTSNKRRGSSDNIVFDEYQQTQYDRINEIREEIKARHARFQAFRMDAKRRADEEEFNRFMASKPVQES